MSEMKRKNAEEEYGDRERENWSSFEETYRDGSLKNECWNSGGKHPSLLKKGKDPEEEMDLYE